MAESRRFASETLWNYAALALTAATGVALTLAIGGRYGAAGLGVFAQLYAIYVVGAQFASFAVHDSVQKHVAECRARGEETAAVARSGLLAVLLPSATVSIALFLGAPLIAVVAGSAEVGQGAAWLAPGVMLFALNKVQFAVLNGERRLTTYALGQIARAVLTVASLVTCLALDVPTPALGLILPAAELALWPLMLFLARQRAVSVPLVPWCWRHWSFGARGVVNAVLLETQLRIDLLVVALFVADEAVGVYAFAALFAEGVYQVSIVVRTVAYPRLVALLAAGDRRDVTRYVRRIAIVSCSICAGVSLVVLFGQPLLLLVVPESLVVGARPLLLILLPGFTLYGLFAPFDQALLQAGLPGRQSLLVALVIAVNASLNVLLVPRFGLPGAATATVAALMSGGLLLIVASRRWLGFRRGIVAYD